MSTIPEGDEDDEDGYTYNRANDEDGDGSDDDSDDERKYRVSKKAVKRFNSVHGRDKKAKGPKTRLVGPFSGTPPVGTKVVPAVLVN